MHRRSSKIPRSTEPSQKKHRTVDSDPGFDAEERGSAPVRKRRGRPPKAKPARHEKNGGPALDAGGGEVRLSPTEGVVEGGDGLIRRRRGRPPKAKIRKDGGEVLRLEPVVQTKLSCHFGRIKLKLTTMDSFHAAATHLCNLGPRLRIWLLD